MALQRTFVMIKPDGVERGLIGECLSRFERCGLKIIGMKMLWVDNAFAQRHYTEDITKRRGEKVRNNLLKYVTEGPVVAVAVEGVDAIAVVRKITGDTEPAKAMPGTIRGDYAHVSISHADEKNKSVINVIHASSDEQDAAAELKLWFVDKELHSYRHSHEKFI